jgi:hypothetical protein
LGRVKGGWHFPLPKATGVEASHGRSSDFQSRNDGEAQELPPTTEPAIVNSVFITGMAVEVADTSVRTVGWEQTTDFGGGEMAERRIVIRVAMSDDTAQSDPVATLRIIARQVRPGGVILFHEPEGTRCARFHRRLPMTRHARWVSETYRRTGVDVSIGTKLYYKFLPPGSQRRRLRMHAVIGGPTALDEVHLDADQAVVLAADIERLGIATAAELDADTLAERIGREMAENKSIIIGRGEIGA